MRRPTLPADPKSLPAATRFGLFATNLVLRGLIGLAMLLPYGWRVRMMGWLVAHVVAPVAGFRRRVRENLALVCPDLPPEEVARLCREVPDNAGRTLIEIYSGSPFIKRACAAPVSGPGLPALESARIDGKPVILVTAHFGNYDVVRANLIARGHHMGALYRRMGNPYFNTHYVRSISRIGTPLFEQGRRGMVQMVKHIRDGGILGIMTDLHVHGGTELFFFGHPAHTSTVPAELALKYDAALIPVYAVRQPNGLDFEIITQAPIPPSDPETMTQAVNDGLETLVRAHMGQWYWIHRRWKKFIP